MILFERIRNPKWEYIYKLHVLYRISERECVCIWQMYIFVNTRICICTHIHFNVIILVCDENHLLWITIISHFPELSFCTHSFLPPSSISPSSHSFSFVRMAQKLFWGTMAGGMLRGCLSRIKLFVARSRPKWTEWICRHCSCCNAKLNDIRWCTTTMSFPSKWKTITKRAAIENCQLNETEEDSYKHLLKSRKLRRRIWWCPPEDNI